MKIIIDEEELTEIISDHVSNKINRQLGLENVRIKIHNGNFGDGYVEIIVEFD